MGLVIGHVCEVFTAFEEDALGSQQIVPKSPSIKEYYVHILLSTIEQIAGVDSFAIPSWSIARIIPEVQKNFFGVFFEGIMSASIIPSVVMIIPRCEQSGC